MTNVIFPVVISKNPFGDTKYMVRLPNFPYVSEYKDTLPDVLAAGQEILALALVGKELPSVPTDEEIKNYIKTSEVDEATAKVYWLPIDLDKAKRETTPVYVKKNTRLRGDLVARAEAANINFSKLLTEALEHKLNTTK